MAYEDGESPTAIALRKVREEAVEREKERWISIIAEWANKEGISFGATTRLSVMLGLES